MTAKKSLWARFGRAINILVLVAFFLPFFGVSCDGIDVITVSGADMAFGCQPGGAAAAAADDPDMEGADMKVDKVEIEPLAIIAFALVVIGAILAWFKVRRAVLASLIVGVLSLGAVVALWIKVGGQITHEIAREMEAKEGTGMMKDAKVESGSRMGLWFALAGLAGVVALSGMALKQRDEILESVQPGGPGSGPGGSLW